MLIAEPLPRHSARSGTALFVIKLNSIYETIRKDQKIIGVYLAFNLVFLTVIGLFRMIQLVIRPIDRVVELTDSYQATDGLFYSAAREHSEFSRLNLALNYYADTYRDG